MGQTRHVEDLENQTREIEETESKASREAQDEMRKNSDVRKRPNSNPQETSSHTYLQSVPLEIVDTRNNIEGISDSPEQRDVERPPMDETKWTRFRDAIQHNDREALKAAFDETRPDDAFVWHVMAERYKNETGRSLDEDTHRILGDVNYSTAKCDFSTQHKEFPFEDVSRMNAKLPTKQDELRAHEMYPDTSALLKEDDYSKLTANEVRYRDRFDSDDPEKNKTGEHWNKAWQEDLADLGYHIPIVNWKLGPRNSIGPMQMQIGNIEELQREDPRLAGLSPTDRANAPLFVAAYMDRSRRRFEDDAAFQTWINSEPDLAKNGLTELRQEYFQAKQAGDKDGMRRALLCTYNAGVSGTSVQKVADLDRVYANPYRREETENRRVAENLKYLLRTA